jgi:hypothetical protein
MIPQWNVSDLMFEVLPTALSTDSGEVKPYYAICRESDFKFLGIKKQGIGFIKNETALEIGLSIYEKLTSAQGAPFRCWMNRKDNKAAMLIKGVSLDQFIQNFWVKILNEINKVSGATNQFERFVKERLINLDVVIGVINGYDIDVSTSYYLLINWRASDQNNIEQDSQLEKSETLFPVERLSKDERVKYLGISWSGKDLNIEKVALNFEADLIDYIKTSFKRYLTTIESRFIIPIIFNLYNRNLSYVTIRNDDKYKEKLITFLHDAIDFENGLSSFTYFAFTEFIIQNCFFFNERGGIQNYQSIISTNQKYKSSLSRLENYYDDPSSRREFENDCLSRFENIVALLK